MPIFGFDHRTALAVLLGLSVLSIARPTILSATVIPPHLPPDSQYQLLFVTAGIRDAKSSNIEDYNAFVTAQAALNPSLPATNWHVYAVASTASLPYTERFPLYSTRGQEIGLPGNFMRDGHSPPVILGDQFGNSVGEFPTVWTGLGLYTRDVFPPDQFEGPYVLGAPAVWSWVGRRVPDNINEDAYWYESTFDTHPSTAFSFFAISDPISVPEPSTMVLACFAVAGLTLASLRRRPTLRTTFMRFGFQFWTGR